jgi:hypothetical protein
MTDEQLRLLIDAAFAGDPHPRVGLSGGEAFLFFDRLCALVSYITGKGGLVSVNTNGFWGLSLARAKVKVQRLKDVGLKQLVVSMDQFHEEYIPIQRPLNVVRACTELHLEVLVQFVATHKTKRLADLLKEHRDDLAGVNCREIACHPVGRAEDRIDPVDLITQPGIPAGRCPASVLSFSADGRAIPCCNAAGHLKPLELGTVNDRLDDIQEKFQSDPVLTLMRWKGPKALRDAALDVGFKDPGHGYIDQCHLCYELFKQPDVAAKLRDEAPGLLEQENYKYLYDQYTQALHSSQTAAASFKPQPGPGC